MKLRVRGETGTPSTVSIESEPSGRRTPLTLFAHPLREQGGPIRESHEGLRESRRKGGAVPGSTAVGHPSSLSRPAVTARHNFGSSPREKEKEGYPVDRPFVTNPDLPRDPCRKEYSTRIFWSTSGLFFSGPSLGPTTTHQGHRRGPVETLFSKSSLPRKRWVLQHPPGPSRFRR